MATAVKSGQGCSQGPGSPSMSAQWVAGSQGLGPVSFTFPDMLGGSWIANGVDGTQVSTTV